MNSVCQWTNERKFSVNKLLARLTRRCDQLGLHVHNDDPQQDFRVSAFMTTLVMNHLFTEKFKRTKWRAVKKALKLLVLCGGTSPAALDQDFSKEMKTKDW